MNSNRATLIITSSSLTPQDITNILKITPTKSYQKGTPANPRIPNTYILPKHGWLLESKQNKEDRQSHIEDKINELANIVESNLSGFKKIIDRIDIEIHCSIFLLRENSSFHLSPSTITRLGLMPIELVVDIYSYEEDMPEPQLAT